MKYIAVFLIALIPLGANASNSTSLELLNKCKKSDLITDNQVSDNMTYIDASFCFGVVTGAIQAVDLLILAGDAPKKYCRPPENWTVAQGVKVFVKWADNNPNKLHLQAVVGVVTSHMQAFCGWKKGK